MEWEVRKKGKKWGIFLVQKYCKTEEDVCYATAFNKKTAQQTAVRLNENWKERKNN
jgi:hypothetical protein